MTKTKSTKRALLMSALSLLLCVSMLIGSTFAWFTDSVVSGKNHIVAGNLDVELEYAVFNEDGTFNQWKTVNNATELFTKSLWEPGHTEVVYLKLSNLGSLALKYQLGINIASEIPGTNVDGDPFKLSDSIYMGVVENKNGENDGYATRDAAVAAVDGSNIISTGYSKVGEMAADAEDLYLAVVVYMPTWIGNEANYKTGTTPPEIQLGINLMATQKDFEEDSFGKDYDENASVTVAPGESIASAVSKVEDGGVVFLENGVHDIASGPIVIEGKTVTIVGLGEVTINKNYGGTHIFTVKNGANVTIENVTMDGKGNTREGVYVRWNSVVTLKDVVIKNTGGKDIMVDEASDAAHGLNTASYVWLYNSHVEDVALCASPVTSVAATQDTYVYFNYDKNSTVGSIEKQSINKKPENIFINGVNVEGNGMNLYVTNDAELKAALGTIKNNSKYHNVQVYVHLAAGTYSADHVINQYPEWNGIVGRNTGNNYQGGVPAGAPNTAITFVGETVSSYGLRGAQTVPAVTFTGNVTVNGFADAQAGFTTATAVTSFENVAFANGSKTIELTAAASNISFKNCVFTGEYVTVGASGANRIGNVAFDGCTFNGTCISGYVDSLISVKNSVVTDAPSGFINNQNNGDVTVDNCTVNVGKYFVRTNNSNIDIEVTDSDITVYESEGTQHLVWFRGSNESAKFIDCTIADGWTTEGVDENSTLEIYNYYNVDGVTYYKDGVTGENTLYRVPAEYEGTTVNVAEGTTNIANSAFASNSNVKEVFLAPTVRDLGRGFDESTVETVVLNEGLTTISSRAFRSTTALKEVVISSTVTEIADNAFQKSGIKEIVIPANVETIGETAFGASLIEKVTFEGDIAIQGYAFRGCTKLRTVIMNGYDVTFVPSTLNGRNSMWFCNGESNNPNTSDIDFYVKTAVVKERVRTAMGAEKDNTDVYCELTAEEGGYYILGEGKALAYDGTALQAALNDEKSVVLAGDITVANTDAESNAYGSTGVNIKNGQTFDGNGNEFGVNAWSTWDSAISITGGTIKNVTISEGMRGIFVNHNSTESSKVYLENVIVDGSVYTISCDQGTNNGLEATDSTFNGWTSYAATIGDVKFTACSFGKGQGYAYCRPYAPTTFVGCDFAEGYKIDARAAVTFENCTIGGVALTAENLATLVTSNIANAMVK